MREAVKHLVLLGAMPSSAAPIDEIETFERYLAQVTTPLTVKEAEELASLLPDDVDHVFGLAWTLLHLIETAPAPAVKERPDDSAGYWIRLLFQRALTG